MNRGRGRQLGLILIALIAFVALIWPDEKTERKEAQAERRKQVPPPTLASAPSRVRPLTVEQEPPKSETRVLHVRVETARDASPVDGARIFQGGLTGDCTRTDEDGKALLPIRPAAGQIGVLAEGYLPFIASITPDTTEIAARLERGASISGRVLDEQNTPVEGVRIWCTPSENVEAWPNPTGFVGTSSRGGVAVSGQDGRFVLHGLQPTTDYEIEWSKKMWIRYPASRPFPIRANASKPLLLHVSPQARVSFAFTDEETGLPVTMQDIITQAGQGVDIGREPLPWIEPSDVSNLWGERAPGDHYYVRVGPTEVTGRQRGSAELTATAIGYVPVKRRVEFEFGKTQTISVPMSKLDGVELGTVNLTVKLNDTPFTGQLMLRLKGESESTWAHAGFRDGRQISTLGLPAGRWELTAKPAGVQGHFMLYSDPVQVDVPPGKAGAASIVLAARVLTLDVRTREGKAVVGYDLGVRSGGKVLNMLNNWDLLVRGATQAGLTRAGFPVLYCSRGVELALAVNKFGAGYYFGPVVAASEAVSGRIIVALDQPAHDYREAWRSQ
jgi:hypothetical protein